MKSIKTESFELKNGKWVHIKSLMDYMDEGDKHEKKDIQATSKSADKQSK